ncbi:hypothetical protein V7A37_06065 [Lactococcus petauri]|uniref:hypothetical protein n=1 Tax=Lactococcus petauri TaxID=1940789 RepID=UPI00313356BC
MTIVESNATVLSFIISLVDQIKPITPTNTGDGGMTNYSHRRATNLRTALVSSFFLQNIKSLHSSSPAISVKYANQAVVIKTMPHIKGVACFSKLLITTNIAITTFMITKYFVN